MNIRMFALVAVSAMLIPATSALADDSMKKQSDSEGMSQSGDMAMKGPKFEEMDTNGDGKISSDELNVYGNTAAGDSTAERRMKRIEKHDMNDDGNISREEFNEAVKKAQ
ncbi:EF-hand domain-containing protein [Marinobacter fonticola]|uniref:EF-hand domain-containing protein n=1 Tax=Marinobacter fonticola TaxID=2603215 RepID=UPI0011E6155D|nr:EF-hand domain-containing protein [Marinobacter fonticola]